MRRKRKLKIAIEPDTRHGSVDVAKFINYLMRRGKQSLAERIVYQAFAVLQEKTKKDPLEIFTVAIRNASPLLELKSRRVGGANYQVPREVRGERRFFLGCKWIIGGAKQRKGKPMARRLADELLDAANNTGYAIKKRADTHRMAEANRAFAHFAW